MIACNRETPFMEAHAGDCVYLTFIGKRHTPVMPNKCGTLTTRGGECGVVVVVNG